MTSSQSQSELHEITIGVITALEKEFLACKGVLDPKSKGKEIVNGESTGEFRCHFCRLPGVQGSHAIAIVQLHGMGTVSAAIGAMKLLHNCPNTRHIIMCGIAGAVPHPGDPESHVRLGDIVVSSQKGIIDYARGKQRDPRAAKVKANEKGVDLSSVPESYFGFEFRGVPFPPGSSLTNALNSVKCADEEVHGNRRRSWEFFIDEFKSRSETKRKRDWNRPGKTKDCLNDSYHDDRADIEHPDDSEWRHCKNRPRVFVGPIGAANIVLADPKRRDWLRDNHGIMAVEMESVGIADASWVAENVNYLVVRGTCDYCNTQKNDHWQKYAALIAAAYTRAILEKTLVVPIDRPKPRIEGPLDELVQASLQDRLGSLPPPTATKPNIETAESSSTHGTDSKKFGEPVSPSIREKIQDQQLLPESVVELVSQINSLLDGQSLSEAVDKSEILFAELLKLPRRGKAFKSAMMLVQKVETKKQQQLQLNGEKPDTTRLFRIKHEVANVIVE